MATTVLDHLRTHLVDADLVRAPDVAGAGARPWLPPCYRHPDAGAIGAGDAKDRDQPATAHDDGLVVTLMFAPGIAPGPGDEERRMWRVNVVYRGTAVPAIIELDQAIRVELLTDDVGAYHPGGRMDWTMAGLYVIQLLPITEIQPDPTTDPGAYGFTTGYALECWAE